jgi:membrane-anchored glycerophosphoryl diester phosphodiesterase (GDPDase)
MNEGGFQKMIHEMAERAQREAHEARKAETISILSALYDRAASYTNLILAAGYAGFFTVWTTMKDTLSQTESLIAALSVTFSLLVFVFWEVGVMLCAAKDLGAIQQALDAPQEKFEKLIQQAKISQERRSVSVRRLWFVILLATIVPGLIGAGVLIYSFIRQLIST